MSATGYLLALDQGTTSSRAILFNGAGIALASAQQELPQIFPGPGLVEHDAGQIWRDSLAADKLLASALPTKGKPR
jgi:glycerol kinase